VTIIYAPDLVCEKLEINRISTWFYHIEIINSFLMGLFDGLEGFWV